MNVDLPSDFKELLEELGRDEVEFLIVGGYAVAFHGRPRATKDIDIFLDGRSENLARAAFADGDLVEHMWVGDVTFDGELVGGVLLNEPNQLTNIHAGEAVSLPLDRVEDWMLAIDDKVLGAFTVNAMRAQMSSKERRAHDEAWGLPFGDADDVRLPSTEDDHPMAIHAAASFAEHLARHPEDAVAVDERGFTVLHREAIAGNGKLVAVALEHEADVRSVTRGGKSALALAREVGWSGVEGILARAGEQTAPGAPLKLSTSTKLPSPSSPFGCAVSPGLAARHDGAAA